MSADIWCTALGGGEGGGVDEILLCIGLQDKVGR